MGRNKRDYSRDYGLALKSAKGFYQQAIPFLKVIGVDGKSHERALADLGGLIASATAMALSIELYLKTLRILMRQSVPQDHNLWTIYKKLPEQLKKTINESFRSRVSAENPLALQSLEICMVRNGQKRPNNASQKLPTDDYLKLTVKDILKRSRDAFTNWRYLYEQPSDQHSIFLQYDYVYQSILAKTLDQVITDILRQNQTHASNAFANN